MKNERVKFSRVKIWFVFIMLFACGSFVGIGIANWGHAVKDKRAGHVVEQNVNVTGKGKGTVSDAIRDFVEREKDKETKMVGENANNEQPLETCRAIENVLLGRVSNNDENCDDVKRDLELYKKLVTYGCDENIDRYRHEIDNKNAIWQVACDNYYFQENTNMMNPDARTCEKIERDLTDRLPSDKVGQSANGRIERAKIYAVIAERGCPENNAKYVDLAKQELEIARAINDDKFYDEDEAVEVVETYKRLKMQRDAEEVFNKVKKLTNPAIDFIMQVEKIINE